MAENQNPNVKEEVNENVEVEATEFTEFTSEKESITEDIQKAQEENSQKITDALAEAERQLKEARLKAFLKEKGLDEGTKFSDLTPEQRAEYDSFDLPEEEKTRIYENAKNAIIPITKQRNETLDSMEDRITGLYTKAKEKHEELQNELNVLPATPENEEKRAQLEKDIASMENIMGELGPEKGSESPMRKTLASALKTHTESNKGVRAKLGKLFGEERVNSDPDIQNTLMTAKERKEMGIEEKAPAEKGDEVEKTEEEQEKENKEVKAGQQVDPKTAAALQQAMKNAGIQPGAAPVVEGEADKAVPTAMQHLVALGYAGGILNVKSSMGLLDEFTKADEKVQLEILKDAEAQSKIFEAMKVANSAKSPITAFKFGKTRRNLVKMANSTMMRKALQDLDKDVDFNKLDEVESKFKSALREYDDIRIKKEAQINALPEGEEKSQLQAELDEINKKYSALTGVKQFRDIANLEMTRATDKFFNFVDSLRSGENVPKLPSKADYEAEKKRDEIYNKAKNLKEQNKANEERTSFNDPSLVNNAEVAEQNQAEREENNKEVKAKDVQDIVK